MSDRPVALITGATGGLGRVLAPVLAADGYDLALFGSDAERLDGARSALDLTDDRVLTVSVNLRDAGSTATAIGAIYERFGRVDALAHLVGGWTGGIRVAGSADEPYASMIDQHLWTTLNVMRELTPRMAEAGYGRIVAVTSPMAESPEAGMSAYAAGKAAEEALLMALAQEVVANGITVNTVRVRTIDPSGDPTVASDKANATTAAEISAAIRFLFSPEARAINGRRIPLYPVS